MIAISHDGKYFMRQLLLKIENIFYTIGDFSLFAVQAFVYTCTPPFRFRLIITQLYIIGVASIGIVALTSIGTGFIFSLQLTTELYQFNAPELAPNVIAHIFAREVGPIFTALMIISKNGSAITAQIGTMKITEQLDALRTMSIHPIRYLVGPRLLACACMFPVLAAFSNLAGLLGSALIIFGLLKIESAFAIQYMIDSVAPAEVIVGIGKAFVMGIVVCIVCCYCGFRSENSSRGVGRATTTAVVASSVAIIVLDFLMGKMLIDTGFY